MIFDTVRGILVRQLDIPPESITMSTDIIDDLGADSLDIVELVMLIEEEFNIVITDETVGNMTKLGQYVEYLNGKL